MQYVGEKPPVIQYTTVYVTKYALTQGILKAEGWFSDMHPGMFIGSHDTKLCNSFYHKGDYELTRNRSIAKARDMRAKKIVSLKKQLKRLLAFN